MAETASDREFRVGAPRVQLAPAMRVRIEVVRCILTVDFEVGAGVKAAGVRMSAERGMLIGMDSVCI
jgi:hypothetical protein